MEKWKELIIRILLGIGGFLTYKIFNFLVGKYF